LIKILQKLFTEERGKNFGKTNFGRAAGSGIGPTGPL